MSLVRLETLYADGTCTPFARYHYERFWRTSRQMGWRPLDWAAVSRAMKEAWGERMRAVLENDTGPSPFFRMLERRAKATANRKSPLTKVHARVPMVRK